MLKNLFLILLFPLIQSASFGQTEGAIPESEYHLPTPIQMAYIHTNSGLSFQMANIDCSIGNKKDVLRGLGTEYRIALCIENNYGEDCVPCLLKMIKSYHKKALISDQFKERINEKVNKYGNNKDSLEQILIDLGEHLDNGPKDFLMLRFMSTWLNGVEALSSDSEFCNSSDLQTMFAENTMGIGENALGGFKTLKEPKEVVLKVNQIQSFLDQMRLVPSFEKFMSGYGGLVKLTSKECESVKSQVIKLVQDPED